MNFGAFDDYWANQIAHKLRRGGIYSRMVTGRFGPHDCKGCGGNFAAVGPLTRPGECRDHGYCFNCRITYELTKQ